eukprot:m.69327 g.69327  ORF g.69327 m.69327 type:complete len:378 (+) comp12044_c0_seq2:71-1204(+)
MILYTKTCVLLLTLTLCNVDYSTAVTATFDISMIQKNPPASSTGAFCDSEFDVLVGSSTASSTSINVNLASVLGRDALLYSIGSFSEPIDQAVTITFDEPVTNLTFFMNDWSGVETDSSGFISYEFSEEFTIVDGPPILLRSLLPSRATLNVATSETIDAELLFEGPLQTLQFYPATVFSSASHIISFQIDECPESTIETALTTTTTQEPGSGSGFMGKDMESSKKSKKKKKSSKTSKTKTSKTSKSSKKKSSKSKSTKTKTKYKKSKLVQIAPKTQSSGISSMEIAALLASIVGTVVVVLGLSNFFEKRNRANRDRFISTEAQEPIMFSSRHFEANYDEEKIPLILKSNVGNEEMHYTAPIRPEEVELEYQLPSTD